jgi:hypothetical protein
MQNEVRMKFNFVFFRALLLIIVCCIFSRPASANIIEKQSLAPIEWEKDFVESNVLSAGGLRLLGNAEIVDMDGESVTAAYGIQLINHLRDQWSGRLGLHIGRTGPAEGEYVWTFLGSDLQHPLIPEVLYNKAVFSYIRPFLFFGLGAVSRWENMTSKLNPVPALRYNISDAVFFTGVQFLIPVAGELMLGFEYRFLQSMKVSRSRGGTAGISLSWGRMNGQ